VIYIRAYEPGCQRFDSSQARHIEKNRLFAGFLR